MAGSQCNKYRGDKVKVILVLGKGHMARRCTQPKRPRNASWYKEKAMLAEAQEARQILDEEQLAFLADPRVLNGQAIQTIIPNNAAFQTEDLDTYDSNCDDISNAQAVLMANIPNYGSGVISEVPHSETNLNNMENQSVIAMPDFEQSPVEKTNKEQNNELVTTELERYKERVKTFEQRLNIDLSSREKMIDSQMDDMIKEKLALNEQVDSLEQKISKQIKEEECLLQTFTVFKSQFAQTVHMLTKPQAFYDNIHKQALGYQNLFHLKKAQRIKPTLYDGIVMSAKHVAMSVIDDEETLILEEESRSKMFKKAKDPEIINKNISHKPIDYEKLNRLSEDFGKRFTPQQEMDAEQAFWFRISNPTIESSNPPLVKVEVPSELPKKRTTPDARIKGEWGFEHTKAVFNNEIILFLKSLTYIFNVFDRDLLNEIMEVQTVFNQMDAAVQQFLVDKQCLEIAKKELFLENDRLLQQIMSQDVLLTMMNYMSLIGDTVNMDGNRNKSFFKEQFDSIKKTRIHTKEQSDSLIDKLNLKSVENEDLKAQIQDKVFVIMSLKNNLRKIKGKEIVDIAAQIPSANTIVPGMFKLDLEPLAPRLLQNREAHIDYLKYTQEQADIRWEIVEQAKAEHPLDKDAKKVVVTLKNKVKKVRFVEPLTSSSNSKQVESSKTSDSNTPVLSSTGLKYSTSKCGTKLTGNKKNDRIPQTPSRNIKNKVEAQPRKVNKKNRIVEPLCDDNVKHSQLNANYDLNCATSMKSFLMMFMISVFLIL
ncbi:hypothetical protein Tco_1051176 [Tanacetum coccineum]